MDAGTVAPTPAAPAKVEIAAVAPAVADAVSWVTVGSAAPTPDKNVQRQSTDPSVPAKTTFQEDLITAGQRRVNLVWEHTQAVIAISVTISVLTICTIMVWRENGAESGAFQLLSNVFFLVVGTYFQRTNHTKTGGVGANELGR